MEFVSSDLDAVEDFVSRAYAKVRLGAEEAAAPTSVSRIPVGPAVRLDRLRFGCTLSNDVDPLGIWCVCLVHEGRVAHTDAAGETTTILPGQLASLNPPGEAATGLLSDTSSDALGIDPDFLTRVAGPRRDAAPVRILGHRPHPGAARRLRGVLDQVRTVTALDAPEYPLVTDTLARYVAAPVIAAFPTTADEEQAGDRRDAHSDTLRRAIAFLESHVREELTITEIAAAAFVTPRAVQLAFRTHLGTTPMEYLRRLRLAGAHEQLERATGGDGRTVTTIARDWGFAHPGRFAAA